LQTAVRIGRGFRYSSLSRRIHPHPPDLTTRGSSAPRGGPERDGDDRSSWSNRTALFCRLCAAGNGWFPQALLSRAPTRSSRPAAPRNS